jgi:hypothetical protein
MSEKNIPESACICPLNDAGPYYWDCPKHGHPDHKAAIKKWESVTFNPPPPPEPAPNIGEQLGRMENANLELRREKYDLQAQLAAAREEHSIAEDVRDRLKEQLAATERAERDAWKVRAEHAAWVTVPDMATERDAAIKAKEEAAEDAKRHASNERNALKRMESAILERDAERKRAERAEADARTARDTAKANYDTAEALRAALKHVSDAIEEGVPVHLSYVRAALAAPPHGKDAGMSDAEHLNTSLRVAYDGARDTIALLSDQRDALQARLTDTKAELQEAWNICGDAETALSRTQARLTKAEELLRDGMAGGADGMHRGVFHDANCKCLWHEAVQTFLKEGGT